MHVWPLRPTQLRKKKVAGERAGETTTAADLVQAYQLAAYSSVMPAARSCVSLYTRSYAHDARGT